MEKKDDNSGLINNENKSSYSSENVSISSTDISSDEIKMGENDKEYLRSIINIKKK
jgi:hypothetical protein